MNYIIPKTAYREDSLETRMSRYCNDSIECPMIGSHYNCKVCLFDIDNLTEDRKQAFLEWEASQHNEEV